MASIAGDHFEQLGCAGEEIPRLIRPALEELVEGLAGCETAEDRADAVMGWFTTSIWCCPGEAAGYGQVVTELCSDAALCQAIRDRLTFE